MIAERDGMPSDTVFALFEDDRRHFWTSSNRGVHRLKRDELDAYLRGAVARVNAATFGLRDGMRSRECNGGGSPSSARDAKGRLWFPTLQGVVMTDPQSYDDGPTPPVPVFERALVAGRTVEQATSVTLPAQSRHLEVTCAAVGARMAERLRFQVRLAGGSDVWSNPQPGPTFYFDGLSAGHYVVEARTVDEIGRASEPAKLLVSALPSVYETPLFRGAIAVVLGGLSVAVVLWRLRALHAERTKLAALVEARTAELSRSLDSLQKAQSELVRAERMASIAALVRGIAHELSNPIGFMTGNLAPLRRYVDAIVGGLRGVKSGALQGPGALEQAVRLSPKKDLEYIAEDIVRVIDDIAEGGRRAKLIIDDLQNLTAGPSRAVEEVDVAHVARRTAKLLAPRAPEGARVIVDAPDSRPVSAYAGEIEQALVNLVDNALRAVNKCGTVTIRVRASDDATEIDVADDGCGMSPEVSARAQEPFYTTRSPGEGSGLGLAIVATIAAHHRGTLSIESAPGEGTTVRLRICDVLLESGA